MTFRVGQKVVCVKVDEEYVGWCDTPEIGAEYHIRWIGCDDVRLIEIRNRIMLCYCSSNLENCMAEPSFFASWFRPAVDSKTDISIFTEMLIPAKGRQLVS